DLDEDAWFDVKVVYQQPSAEIEMGDVPRAFMPKVGPFHLTDYEKVYAADPDDDIFAARGIDRDGVIVVVRPDQYIAHILPLDDHAELSRFFAGVFEGARRTADA